VPLDEMREFSEDFIFEDDDELLNEEKFEEFTSFFVEGPEPKLLMTTSEKPS